MIAHTSEMQMPTSTSTSVVVAQCVFLAPMTSCCVSLVATGACVAAIGAGAAWRLAGRAWCGAFAGLLRRAVACRYVLSRRAAARRHNVSKHHATTSRYVVRGDAAGGPAIWLGWRVVTAKVWARLGRWPRPPASLAAALPTRTNAAHSNHSIETSRK